MRVLNEDRRFIAEVNTSAQLSCYVTGLTKQLDTVTWKESGNVITDGTDGYKIDVGTYVSTYNSQETTITVPADRVTRDLFFKCIVQCKEYGKEAETRDILLQAFSKSIAALSNNS